MSNSPVSIEKISPPLVCSALIRESFGTYVLRHATENDQIISAMRFPGKSSVKLPFAVLSIRVDETVYRCPLMHYYLRLNGNSGDLDQSKLLDRYRERKDELRHYTPLQHACPIEHEQTIWNLDSHQIAIDGFKTDGLSGKNNGGISGGQWRQRSGNDIKGFMKR